MLSTFVLRNHRRSADGEYKLFRVPARGDFEYFTEVYTNKRQYIGRQATVRYQSHLKSGVPRYPCVMAIRDYE